MPLRVQTESHASIFLLQLMRHRHRHPALKWPVPTELGHLQIVLLSFLRHVWPTVRLVVVELPPNVVELASCDFSPAPHHHSRFEYYTY